MKRLSGMILVCLLLQVVAVTFTAAYGSSETSRGSYIVKEGLVSQVTSRSLVLENNQYPISRYVRVFLNSETGVEMPMHAIANTGKIDRARIYLLGGKVEKIIVLKNI